MGEKCDGSLKVENKKKKVMIAELQRKNFDPDPVKKWKNDQAKLQAAGMDALDEPEDGGGDLDEDAKDADYDYLMGMAMWSLTAERKEALLKQKEGKHDELRKLRKTTKEDMWITDLDEFIEKLTEVETKERGHAISSWYSHRSQNRR